MSGDPAPSSPPVAYSYDTTGGGETTGHTVTIAPGQLDASIAKFKQESAGRTPRDLTDTLQSALLTENDFGQIPNAGAVGTELTRFVKDHVDVMRTMGGVLADFVARVQAAAQLGYLTDPETRRQMAWARMHEN